MRGALVGLSIVVAAAGCVFDDVVDEEPLPSITCAGDDDCPSNLRCDLDVNRCLPFGTKVDVTAPAIDHASFVPAVAREQIDIHLEIVASEDLARAPALVFDGREPDLRLDVEGPRAFTWTILLAGDGDLGSGEDDDRYTLSHVEIEDESGNRARVPVNATLLVDRVSPVLADLATDRARYSSVAPYDTVAASVFVGEPLDQAPRSFSMLLDERRFLCSGYDVDTSSYACLFTIDDDVPEGTHVVQAVAVDAAGNVSIVGAGIEVDHTAPSVAGDAQVHVFTPTGAESTVLAAGDTAHVTFTASEPLSAALARAIGPAQIDFAVAITDDTHVDASLFVTAPPPSGTYALEVDLVDALGNDSGFLQVALPPPQLVSSPRVPSPCVARSSAGDPVCTDFDDDGAFGSSATCPEDVFTDCNDADPLVHAGAIEVAGNFVDDGCGQGQGAPLDDVAGVFVAPGAGAVAAALATLDARDTLFLREGTYAEGHVSRAVGDKLVLVGGLDADGLPTGRTSRLTVDCSDDDLRVGLTVASPVVLQDVDVSFTNCAQAIQAPQLLVRRGSLTGDCGVNDGCYLASGGDVVVFDSRLDGVRFASDTLQVIDSVVDDTALFGDDVRVVRSIVTRGNVTAQSATLVSSTTTNAALAMSTSLHAYQSTLATDRIYVNADADVILAGSIVTMREVLFDDEMSAGTVLLLKSDIVAPCVNDSCIGSIGGCDFPGATQCFSTLANVAPGLLADGVHLDPQSQLVDQGLSSLLDHGEPTSAAGDIDGECRDTFDQPDLGADEVR